MRAVVYPADWMNRSEQLPLRSYANRFLAEGDSWFTIGTLNLPEASNVLYKLEFTLSNVIINCAFPGDTLQHVVDSVRDPFFDRLLRRKNFASFWEAILISAGGNDLIDAAQVPRIDSSGAAIPPDRRLLLSPDEAPPVPGPGATSAMRHGGVSRRI